MKTAPIPPTAPSDLPPAASTSNATPLRWREVLGWTIVLCLLLPLHFPGFFFHGERMSGYDCLYVVSPWEQYAPKEFKAPANTLLFDHIMSFRPDALIVQDAYKNGRLPLWNPRECAGMPTMANCQSQAFLPSNVLSLLLFDVDTAMSLQVLWRILLAGVLAYLSFRMLGSSLWASRFFSILWAFSPYYLNTINWPMSNVNAWWPVLFAGTELIRRGQSRKGFLFVSLAGGCMLMGGHPQTAFVFAGYTALYFVVSMALFSGSFRLFMVSCIQYAAAWALGLGMACVQAVPFLDYLRQFTASDIRAYITPPKILVSLFVSRFWGSETDGTFWSDDDILNCFMSNNHYVGLAAMAGIVLCFAALTKQNGLRGLRHHHTVLLGCAAVATGISMSIPPFSLLMAVKGFTTLRLMYHINFLSAALCVLGAWGLERWFETEREPQKLLSLLVMGIPVAFIVAASVIIAQFSPRYNDIIEFYTYKQIAIALVLGLIVLGILYLSCFSKRTRVFWVGLIGITIVDLAWATHGQNPTMPKQQITQQIKLFEYMKTKPQPCRLIPFFNEDRFVGIGAMNNYGLEEWTGYDGLFPESTSRFITHDKLTDSRNFRRVLAAEYYLVQSKASDWSPEFTRILKEKNALEYETTIDGVDVYRLTEALPRARLVGTVQETENKEALWVKLAKEGKDAVDVTNVVLTSSPPSGALPNTTGFVGEATISRYENERVVIDCSATTDCALVLADTYFSGWQAFVDGKRSEIFPAYDAFRGVLIPQGKHTVEFVYKPVSLTVGLLLSGVFFLIWLTVLFFYLKNNRAPVCTTAEPVS